MSDSWSAADMKGGSFNRAKFVHNGELGLYTAVNAAGCGHILHWEQVRFEYEFSFNSFWKRKNYVHCHGWTWLQRMHR